MANESHYVFATSTTKVLMMASKLGRRITYLDGFLAIERYLTL